MLEKKFEDKKMFTLKDLRRLFKIGMWTGGALVLALISLYQDFLGKERYIECVKNYWVNSNFSIPISFVILGTCLWSINNVLYRKFE